MKSPRQSARAVGVASPLMVRDLAQRAWGGIRAFCENTWDDVQYAVVAVG